MSSTDVQPSLIELLRRDGVISAGARLQPLSGGVSSDIFLIEDAGPPRVVKRALPTLRVADVWNASISRNEYEKRYLNYVSRFLPDSVPTVLAEGDGYFVMPYFGSDFTTWKSRLLSNDIRLEDAEAAATFLGRVHEHSRNDPGAARLFDSLSNFRQLRIDPYLLTLGKRYPEIQGVVRAEADRLAAWRECLVHGDFSPKNMLLNESQLIVLDAEVAWYGEPAFDLAFVISHLLLKSLFHAPRDLGLRRLVETCTACYLQCRRLSHSEQASLQARVGMLVSLLLLARVDGKSPVEYLDEPRRRAVRSFVLPALQREPRSNSNALCDDWFRHIEMIFSAT
jgi:aminoglycoside phosphotransferase (APT) family kinase protein